MQRTKWKMKTVRKEKSKIKEIISISYIQTVGAIESAIS